MRSGRWIAGALAAAAFVAGATGCGRHASSPGPRLIVLGIDGMDYRVTRDLMAAGRMPHFARLAASGTFAPLATSFPPQSPVAWSSVTTGLDPAGHGIFDFVHRDAATLEPFLSTSRPDPPRRHLTIGSWRLPMTGGAIMPLRRGEPFWSVLEDRGVPTAIIRMPANFPPSGTATRELSGMGTPDLLGTYGTFTFFTSAPAPGTPAAGGASAGRVSAVDVVDGVVRTELVGPDHPFRRPAQRLSVAITIRIDAAADAARLTIGREARRLAVGEWSDWVPIEFPLLPFQRLRGMCRFYLKQVRPTLQLYVSPINLDPLAPAMVISTPASYAATLARATGRFYTQGIAEDTKALTEHVLTRDEFLRQARLAGDEAERQYWQVLRDLRERLLFFHFGNLDQVSHMLWRARDPDHPAYDRDRDAPYRQVIDDLYVAFDRIVGETLRRVGPDTTLIVLSDHGFTSWRRSFNLNGWLRDRGYLAVVDRTGAPAQGAFPQIDWTRTRAYGLGLNGLYVNLRGRERHGIVAPEDRDRLVAEIRRALLETADPETGRAAITQVFVTGSPNGAPGLQTRGSPDGAPGLQTRGSPRDTAPDLVVGYAEGTRVSNESALGGVPAEVLRDNTGEWSGDHCMDPVAVPGILLTSRRLRQAPVSLDQVAAAILAEFKTPSAATRRTAGARAR